MLRPSWHNSLRQQSFHESFMGSGSACESSGLGYSNRRARARRARSRLGSGLTPAGRYCLVLRDSEGNQLQDVIHICYMSQCWFCMVLQCFASCVLDLCPYLLPLGFCSFLMDLSLTFSLIAFLCFPHRASLWSPWWNPLVSAQGILRE